MLLEPVTITLSATQMTGTSIRHAGSISYDAALCEWFVIVSI